MSRFLSLLWLALLIGTTAQAQSGDAARPAQAAADSGAVLLFNGWYLPRYQPAGAEADTTGALLSLFRRRRTGGWLFAAPFIVGMTLSLPIESTDSNGQRTVAPEAISPPLGIAVLGATVAGFIWHSTSFNKAHLQAVSKAYAAGKPVPVKYRRRLGPQHFAEAAFLRQALAQQQERERQQAPANRP